MQTYDVTGMSCAACSAHVEKAVKGVAGVTECTVSLLTNSMKVDGTAPESEIIAAVEKAGYGAGLRGADASAGGPTASQKLAAQEEALRDKETPVLRSRLIRSLGILLVLMYFSMGHMMWGWPVPELFHNHVALAVFEMLLAIVVMDINRKFFTSGFGSLIHGSPNMDTLVALGSTASFGYSLVELFIMISAMGRGDMATVDHYAMNLYFESAAMIPTLITIGKMLEAMSKGRTTDALKSLMKLAPKTAVIERDGKPAEVGIDEVAAGDIFIVKPGESIPVDGVILEGSTAVNEAALTGESIPVDKAEGDHVSAATVNQNGFIRCRAERVGEDTTLSQIIQMVSDAAATKAPLARIADKISGIFVPAVMGIAVLTCIGWLLAGREFGFAIARGISVLVISCPCALGLATPVAIMVGSGMGAKHGILYKTAESLEHAGRTQFICLDKTGTITKGEPSVTDVIPAADQTVRSLLELAYTLEKRSEHPLAKAVVAYAQSGGSAEQVCIAEDGASGAALEDFRILPGNGLTGTLLLENGSRQEICGGNQSFIQGKTAVPGDALEQAERLAEEGKTPLYFSSGGSFAGIIAVADTIKEDSAQAIRELQGMGIHVAMLTGDNERTAAAIGRTAGVDEVIAGVLPDGKESVVRRFKKKGVTAMVGDGINDAPALTRADVGIAIGAGTDVAIDAADVVLMKSSLLDVAAAVRMSRATIRNIHENLFWAFIYNAFCIPLAIGLYGIAMKPMYGAAAMSMSSFCVCMNALRLNLFKIHDASHDKKIKYKQKKETKDMTKTMTIEGMMCVHCEANVKKALEALDGVASADVSHEKGTAVVELDKAVADDVLKKAVEDKDYKVLGIA